MFRALFKTEWVSPEGDLREHSFCLTFSAGFPVCPGSECIPHYLGE